MAWWDNPLPFIDDDTEAVRTTPGHASFGLQEKSGSRHNELRELHGMLYLLTMLLVPPLPIQPLAMVACRAVPPGFRRPTQKAAVAAIKPVPVKLCA
jgi:hypothetical protein